MRHIFIINPAAGKKDGRQRVYAMAEALKKNHNLDVECMLTKSRGHATALTRAIAETGDYVRFYACGGDGTVNEIANGIAGFPNAAMTCIPIGTGNDFLKNFGKDAEPLFLDADLRYIENSKLHRSELLEAHFYHQPRSGEEGQPSARLHDGRGAEKEPQFGR